MDKAEYQDMLDELNSYVHDKDYESALTLVNEIDWKRVKSIHTLLMVADVYEENQEYEDAKHILKLALNRTSLGRTILQKLVEVCIKLGEISEAEEYFDRYTEIAGNDNARYLLQYKLFRAKRAPLDDQISVLEEYRDHEYTEKYAYELAKLYAKAGDEEKCVAACDDLILWFGGGKYALRAMELKKKYRPLTASQQKAYDAEKIKEEKAEAVRPKKKKPLPENSFEMKEKLADSFHDVVSGLEQKPVKEDERTEKLDNTVPLDQLHISDLEPDDTQMVDIPQGAETIVSRPENVRKKEVRKEEKEEPKVWTDIGINKKKEPDTGDVDLDSLLKETAGTFSREIASGGFETEESPSDAERTGSASENAPESGDLKPASEEGAVTGAVAEANEEADSEPAAEETGETLSEPAEEETAEAGSEPSAKEPEEGPAVEPKPENDAPDSGKSGDEWTAVSFGKASDEAADHQEAGKIVPEAEKSAPEVKEAVPEESSSGFSADAEKSSSAVTGQPFGALDSAKAAGAASGEVPDLESEADLGEPAEKEAEAKEEAAAAEKAMESVQEEKPRKRRWGFLFGRRAKREAEEAAAMAAAEEKASAEKTAAEAAKTEKEAEENVAPEPAEETNTASAFAGASSDERPEKSADETEQENEASFPVSGNETAAPSAEAMEEEKSGEPVPAEENVDMEDQSSGKEKSYQMTKEERELQEGLSRSINSFAQSVREAARKSEELRAKRAAEEKAAAEKAAAEKAAAEAETAKAAAEKEAEERARAAMLEAEARAAAEKAAAEKAAAEKAEAEKEAAKKAAAEKEAARARARAEDEKRSSAFRNSIRSALERDEKAKKERETRVQTVDFGDREQPEQEKKAEAADQDKRLFAEEDARDEAELAARGLKSSSAPKHKPVYNEELEVPDPVPAARDKLSHSRTLDLSQVGENTIPVSLDEIIMSETPEERRIRFLHNEESLRMNDDQRRIFTYFARIPGLDTQILSAMTAVYQHADEHTSSHGNLAVMGAQGSGKSRLTQDLILAMCLDLGMEAAKIARISGIQMNLKDPAKVVSKMAGGFLMIEECSDMNEETVSKLSQAMDFRTDRMVLIIEDEKAAMRGFLKKYPDFAKKIEKVISIPIFTNDELITFARTYAEENHCKIDDMAVLALYTIIGNNQSYEEPMTIARVKGLLDQAISHARKNQKHKGRGRRGRESVARLVLQEKDFETN